MSTASEMRVIIRLPTRSLFDGRAIALNATARDGAFGVLPNHVDLMTALVPSVLLLTLPDGAERVFGIDEGVFVKRGHRGSPVEAPAFGPGRKRGKGERQSWIDLLRRFEIRGRQVAAAY